MACVWFSSIVINDDQSIRITHS